MAEAEEQETESLEESTDESEEEESEEEPKLKYERLSNGVTEILQKDAASCMTVHDKFLALGTHYGKVYLLDVQGNITQKFDVSPVKINQISLDESGEHMGVCSEDGKLLLFERSWMSRWKSSVLHEGEGNIRSVKWRGHLIAWANNMGVKIFDITSKQRITNVPRDDISLRPDMYPCSLCWKDSVTLIIGWGTSVKICSVKERHASEMRDLPSRYVEIGKPSRNVRRQKRIHFSKGKPKIMFVFREREYCARPRLDIIQPLSETCEEISSDALTVRGFQENECRDYHLEYSEGESLFYIVSPRDVVVAKERDQDDHIDWLLEKKKYEVVLILLSLKYLHTCNRGEKVSGFASLIREWPGDLYNNSVIVQAVRDHLKKDSQNRTLLKTLAELFSSDTAGVSDCRFFFFLFQKAVDMLLDNEDKISIKKVVEELEDRPELQHVYLHKLFKRDHHKGQRYHEKQISLYAEYDRSNLLPFLRDSTHCPLEKALEICQQRNFVEETVYLLSRMGNSRSALKMIMEELHDVDKAIEFAKEQDDGELWEDLILYSIDKPPFITGLLNNIGTHVDPILLIHRIKEGMEIPNLRDSLVKILQDYNLQILLREGCKKILVADSLSLLKKMHRTQMKGVLVDEENICESCLSPILPSDAAKPFSVLVFHCRHMFHKECLPGPSTNSPAQFCGICSAKHRGPGSAILEMKK
ncbi:vacuolar protein sorting-associated protein 41 homolog [Leptonychotes weddellii]|uniref:Vacuolar protein sorting-associated protein 41 homolog n=1 Tax=Leptonychotes weddellii TaxID=9713 RepID=A0A7F8R293_LEPWE|nr:vacuolar protein sorting-associated protein 41 homolog [Leptonychotes weddellii]